MSVATDQSSLEKLSVDTIRTLSMDAVQQANSGHPGTPMALAPVAYALFTRVMKHDPADSQWIDRDRFVLSAGHACMLLYSTLYLTGYDLTLDDLKQFRQMGSKTPGHPEYHHTYVIASDGDMQEGVQGEAASLAGHLGLGRLIVFYDDNHISIEGDTSKAMSEDVGKRYEAYGWEVVHLGEDIEVDKLTQAFGEAKETEQPTLII